MIGYFYLSIDQVIALHDSILDNSGGLRGIRDIGLLESALDAPKVAMFGMEMYKTGHEKSAVLLYHIIKNHPFNDGNKRTAFMSWIAFCEINHLNMESFEKPMVESLCVSIAEGIISKENLLELFRKL